MHILKKLQNFLYDFPKDVINDLYKLCFQNYCTLYIVNISSYKKEKLKLHRSFLSVRGRKYNHGHEDLNK